MDVAKTASVTEATIQRMVRPESVARELQALEINRVVKRAGGVIDCFHCRGTGIMNVALHKEVSASFKVIPTDNTGSDSRKCYLCNGTGKISEFLTRYDAPPKGADKGKDVNDDDDDDDDDDSDGDNECLICMSEPVSRSKERERDRERERERERENR